jgi:hypothetical protein
MINLRYSVTYPKVNYSNPGNDPTITRYGQEKEMRGMLALPNDSLPREDVCDILFAGFGNHPGNEQDYGSLGYRFTTGDKAIDMAHLRWAMAQVRSMSVGDIVNFENSNLYYICGPVGWIVVDKVNTDSWRNWPREHGCDLFEVRQWMKAYNIVDKTTLS